MKKQIRFLLYILILVPLSFTCKPTTLYFGKPSIIGSVYRYTPYGERRKKTGASVLIRNSRLLPVVRINKDTLELTGYWSGGEYLWDSEWFHDNLGINLGQACSLKVFQSNGEANAIEWLPGDIAFQSPRDSSILRKGQGLSFTWTKATGTDRYIFDLYIYYSYEDTNGWWESYYLDTIISIFDTTQTSLNIPASVIFPGDVAIVYYGYGYARILAESGPRLGRVKEGNIKGNGVGYFWAQNESKTLYIIIEEEKAGKVACKIKEPLSQKLLKQRIEQFKKLEEID